MTVGELKEILAEFLIRWKIENVRNLTLQEYVGLGNKDTFCQWVETKTRVLGSIKGLPSIKFGIYERRDPNKMPKNYKNDNQYSWLQGYGDYREAAFEKTKYDILRIIELSEIGNFSEIDNILLPNLFKWKVAFLYSNERLIPIFKQAVLYRIANHFGMKTNSYTKVSEIQNLMILNKPAHLDVFTYMYQLFEQFGDEKEKKEAIAVKQRKKERRTRRNATNSRNTKAQVRILSGTYIAEQKHNKIQEALIEKLSKKYGKESVIVEENYVDVKLIQPDLVTFYEVKSSSYATECIKEALGQILLYSFNDTDIRPKKHIVVGQYPATDNDEKYIDFLKLNLKLELDYLDIPIE